MLFGQKTQDPKPNTAAIIDVGTEDFESAVLQASMETPIVVDFWAPWCGPCKQLMPVLESAIAATKGAVRMAKINIDENPDLAQALRVQSIPTVFVFFQGRPVTAFTGLKSASELKALMDQLSKMGQQARPDAINIPETLHTAQTALNDGQIKVAQGLFMQILEQDENNAPAYAGLVRSFILIGDLDQAAAMLDDVPQTMGQHAEITAARSALELARQADSAKGDLKKYERLAAEQPENKQAQFDHAMALFAAGQQERAIDILIALIAADRNNSEKWEGDKARLQLLKFFEALGPSHPLAISGRRKLSSLLFS